MTRPVFRVYRGARPDDSPMVKHVVPGSRSHHPTREHPSMQPAAEVQLPAFVRGALEQLVAAANASGSSRMWAAAEIVGAHLLSSPAPKDTCAPFGMPRPGVRP